MKFKAVTADELKARLGNECSPSVGRKGYVIGPDANGRLCHCATHLTYKDALKHAAQLNENLENDTRATT